MTVLREVVLALLLGCGAHAAMAADTPPTVPAPVRSPAASDDPLMAEVDAAVALARSGQRDLARARLEDLARRWPQRPEPEMNLATLAIQDQDAAAARSHLEAALRTSAAHARAYELLQLLHAQMARQAYDRALGTARSDAPPLALPWTTTTATIAGPPASAPGPSRVAAGPAAASDVASSTTPGTAGSQAPALPPTPSASDVPTPASDIPATSTPIPLQRLLWVALGSLLLLAAGLSAVWARGRATDDRAPVDANARTATNTAALPFEATRQEVDDEPLRHRGEAPEARLIAVYRLIGEARLPQALAAIESLVRDVPQFALGQLVYGDLLLASTGDLTPAGTPAQTSPQAQALRREAVLRLQALRDPPAPGSWPSQVLQLSGSVRHVVAVDTSRARLYVIENQAGTPRLVGHHYVSIGSRGTGKRSEGDQRTPLGIYSITSHLDGGQLGDFYGAGALPLNYPNDLDRHLGRTGANIWIHGTPTGQYARAPLSTNGCIVMANDDLSRWLRLLAPRHTPVIVAERLEWVAPRALMAQRQTALGLVESWRRARMHSDLGGLMAMYSMHFDNGEDGYDAWRERLQAESRAGQGRERELDELSVLSWNDPHEMLVVTFRERLRGSTHGLMRRQYWTRESGQWRIFSEGVLE
ncbi:L,D-transpeptidase family protein [Leptothrix discophora]|uniref:L,D-transpeptidase family protein n=1 Tax=Leptothrix discophora TaxID=89 RepID=A0ABT9G567_LEPDI|nr:L,D-transpeptidase family protein [Leptothrix discophora]MDP4301614.1 L,D-transpeptidase family protein [Leptothrix discophora]